MFESYSFRACRVVMLTSLKAGKRGAAAIELEDLLVALLIEDQGGSLKASSDNPGDVVPSNDRNPPRQFFSPDVANNLLARIEVLSTKSQPLPLGSEMPISMELKRVFDEATRLRDELQQRKVQPLHLLAAALAEVSSKAVQAFREAGITRENVLKTIREEVEAAARRKPLITAGTAATVATPVHSSRTNNVNYLAHLKARMRGSAAIEIEDMLIALLIEDQGGFLDALSEVGGIGIDITHIDLRPYPPALAPSIANDLLARVEAFCSRSEPLPPQSAIPMSEGVKRVFAVADLLRETLQRNEITPLHLLAATLEEESSKAVQAFREAGITRGSVVKAIREETKS